MTPCISSLSRRRAASLHIIALGALVGLTACAAKPEDPAALAQYEQNNDPIEPTNRTIFAGNQFVDRNALQPVARGYEEYVPGAARRGIHNFVSNLGEPTVAVNDVLQGNMSRAWTTTQRFAINTVAGGAGVFDVATDWHRPGHSADFGQTFGVWGVGPGPTVQLPLFGASNVRDSVGKVAGMVTDPANLVTGTVATVVSATKSGLGVVDGRAELLPATEALEHTSLDYYAALRSVTAQRRAALVEQGKVGLVAASGDGTDTVIPVSTTGGRGTP